MNYATGNFNVADTPDRWSNRNRAIVHDSSKQTK